MMALAAIMLLQAAQPSRPPLPPGYVLDRPCPNGARECPPWERHASTAPPGWVSIGRNTVGAVWYVHRGTMTTTAYGETRIWVRIDHSRDRSVPERRSEGLVALRCEGRLYHWESLTRYTATDRQLRPSGMTRQDNIAPDSMIEQVWRFACNRPAAAPRR